MKLIEAINRADELRPNDFTREQKIAWLSALDGIIKNEITDTHEDPPANAVSFKGYGADTPLSTQLLADAPYDELYITYLTMKIDYGNAEYAKYNNSTALYNTQLAVFSSWYNRTHMPRNSDIKFFEEVYSCNTRYCRKYKQYAR